MNEYNVITDAIELISGTRSVTSPLYIETAKILESSTPQGKGYLKNFVTSIESIASKGNVRDSRISGTKGNIKQFSGYENIKTILSFLSTNLSGMEIVKNLTDIFKSLENNQAQYMDGYSKQIRLIMLEYESAVYMLVTGLAFSTASYVDIQQKGSQVKIIKKGGTDKGVITKTIRELAKQLNARDHKGYLSELVKTKDAVPTKGIKNEVKEEKKEDKKEEEIKESVILEATISDTIELIDSIGDGVKKIASFGKRTCVTIKRTMFGIIPLIRSILYLKYKKKADTILALDQQAQFIQMNIDQLKNIKGMDETKKAEIIKKQQAVIEAYRKKAEKLRAQLVETEKDAATAINGNNPEIKKDSSDDFIFD